MRTTNRGMESSELTPSVVRMSRPLVAQRGGFHSTSSLLLPYSWNRCTRYLSRSVSCMFQIQSWSDLIDWIVIDDDVLSWDHWHVDIVDHESTRITQWSSIRTPLKHFVLSLPLWSTLQHGVNVSLHSRHWLLLKIAAKDIGWCRICYISVKWR